MGYGQIIRVYAIISFSNLLNVHTSPVLSAPRWQRRSGEIWRCQASVHQVALYLVHLSLRSNIPRPPRSPNKSSWLMLIPLWSAVHGKSAFRSSMCVSRARRLQRVFFCRLRSAEIPKSCLASVDILWGAVITIYSAFLDIKNSISWYQEMHFLIKRNAWFQEFDFLISRNNTHFLI